MRIPMGIQQVRRSWPQQPHCLGSIFLWRCGSPSSPAYLCVTNDGDNESEGVARMARAVWARLSSPPDWWACVDSLPLKGWPAVWTGPGLRTPKSWSKARLEDRWREGFQTILLPLISAAWEPPEELQVTPSPARLRYFSEPTGAGSLSLCSDWSGNLERIRFLSTHDASECACGSGGGVENYLSHSFSLFFRFWHIPHTEKSTFLGPSV